MNKEEVKPGVKVRHTQSGKDEEIVEIVKVKLLGSWFTGVLYKGIDRETNQLAMFVRPMDDFILNFELR